MRINSEKATHDGFNNGPVVVWELCVFDDWKEFFVRKLLVDPIHEQGDVFRSRDLDSVLVSLIISPEVFVLRRRTHNRTRLRSTLITHGAIDQVDLIEEVDNIDTNPFVHIIPIRNFYSFTEVVGIKRCFQYLVSKLVHFISRIGRFCLAARLESLVPVENREHSY